MTEPPVPGAVLIEGAPEPQWAVEIGSLGELMALCEQVGTLIVSPAGTFAHPWIEVPE